MQLEHYALVSSVSLSVCPSACSTLACNQWQIPDGGRDDCTSFVVLRTIFFLIFANIWYIFMTVDIYRSYIATRVDLPPLETLEHRHMRSSNLMQ